MRCLRNFSEAVPFSNSYSYMPHTRFVCANVGFVSVTCAIFDLNVKLPERRFTYLFVFVSHVLAPVFVSTYYSLTIIAFHLDYSPDRLCTPQRLSVPHATTALSRRPPTFVRRCCSRTRPRSCLHAIATPTLRLVFHSALCLPYDMCLLHVLSLPIALLMCRSQAICDSNDSPISPSISKPTVRRPTSLSIRALALARSRFRSPLTQLSISRFDIRRTFDVSAYPVTTLTLPSLGLL